MSADRSQAPGGVEIRLVPLGRVERAILGRLRRPLARRFHAAAVWIEPPIELRRDWYDPERGQYRADPILDALSDRAGGRGWSLGLLDGDLYAPGLNFIFGQATVGGCCAIIGLARLRPEYYQEPPDPSRFHRRTLTEAVHELGHVAGRDHCPDPACVMHFSVTLADTDRKGADFCPRCRR